MISKDAIALHVALLDGLISTPRRPLSVAAGMVKASPAAARSLLERLEATEELIAKKLAAEGLAGTEVAQRSIFALTAMIARLEARRLLDEIENDEDEKLNHDAVAIPARVESTDDVKLPEPVSSDANQPWLVWIPARKVPADRAVSQL